MVDLRDDDADDARWMHTAQAKRLCQDVGREIMLLGIGLDGLAALHTDAGTVFQGPRHRGHGNAHGTRDVLHGDGGMVIHLGYDYVITRCRPPIRPKFLDIAKIIKNEID